MEAGQSQNCTHDRCRHPVHASLSSVSPAVEGGRVLESEVCSEDPGRGQLLAAKKPEGEGVRSYTTTNVCRGSLGRQRSKVSLLSGAQEVGPTLQPPPPPQAAASLGTGGGTHPTDFFFLNQGHLLKPE